MGADEQRLANKGSHSMPVAEREAILGREQQVASKGS